MRWNIWNIKGGTRWAIRVILLTAAKWTIPATSASAGYNIVAIPLAAGLLYGYGIVLTPALGAALMSLSTIIVALNSQTLRI